MYPTKKLGEIVQELFAGGDLPKNGKYSKEKTNEYKIPIYANAIKDDGLYGYTSVARVLEPSITISARGTIGFTKLRLEPFYPIVRLLVLIPKKDLADLNFLVYVINTLNLKQFGSSIPQLSVPQLKNFTIPLPPLQTQKLIVQKLDQAFENIDKNINLTKDNLKNLDELNKSILEKVFSQGFNEYKLKKILEIADVKSGKRLPKGERVLDEKTNYPYIRVSDFGDNGTIDLSNIKYISDKVYKSISNYIITDENLYISIAGTIGKTGIIPKELNGANLTENAVRLVYKNKYEIYNNYIYYFTISENFKKQAGLATRAVAMPKLAITRLKEIQIPIPPLEKQKEIVSYLDQVFEKNKNLKTKYENQLKELEELKQSLLKDAFEGKLAI